MYINIVDFSSAYCGTNQPLSFNHRNTGKISIFFSLSHFSLSLSLFVLSPFLLLSFLPFLPFLLIHPNSLFFFFCLLLSSFPFHFPFSLISLIFFPFFHFLFYFFVSFPSFYLFFFYLILIIQIGKVRKLPPHFPSLTHVILSNFLIFMIFFPH